MQRTLTFTALSALLLLSLIPNLTACDSTSANAQSAPVQQAGPRPGGRINGRQAHQLVADGAMLLDVRTTGEFGAKHLDGAVNIPVGALATQKDKLPAATDTPIVVYCLSGARSSHATRTLTRMGYTHVYDLGGFGNW